MMECPSQNVHTEGKMRWFLPHWVKVATESCKHRMTDRRKGSQKVDPEMHPNHPNASSTFLFLLLYSIQLLDR